MIRLVFKAAGFSNLPALEYTTPIGNDQTYGRGVRQRTLAAASRTKAYDLWPIAETFGVFVFGASAMAQEPEPVAPVGHRS